MVDEGGSVVDGRFRLVHQAGQGGFGAVYRALDETTGQTIALKVLSRDGCDLARFEREAHLLATVAHPRVVGYLGHGHTADGRPYLAMEWLEGHDLAARLERGPLTPAAALAVTLGAAQGLAAAHAKGIIHRDIKPANIFLAGGSADDVRVIDFGVARSAAIQTQLTTTGAVLGTPAYMAPEQTRGTALSPRTDVFALGCVLFECVTGVRAFRGDTPHAVLASILDGRMPRVTDLSRDAPPILDALLVRMLARDPLDRFADGATTALALSSARIDADRTALEILPTAVVSAGDHMFRTEIYIRSAAHVLRDLERVVSTWGGSIDIADGEMMVASICMASATEAAVRAAACALDLRAAVPSVRVFLRSGDAGAAQATTVCLERDEDLDACEPGEIRVCRITSTRIGGAFDLEPNGASALLLRKTPQERSEGRFVGRGRELAALEGAYSEMREEGSLVALLVLGEAGIGKSRLLQAFVERLLHADAPPTVLRAHADRPTASSPFWLVAELLRDDLRVKATTSPRPAEPRARWSADGLTELEIDFLLELSGRQDVVPSASIRAARLDATAMADGYRSSWISFVQAALRRGPLVLITDDLHFADPSSVGLLEVTLDAARNDRVLLCASARPDEARTALFDRDDVERVMLKPLRPNMAAALVRAVAPDVAQDAVQRVVTRAAGNPLQLVELARLGDESLPGSVAAAIDARLARAAPATRRVLRAASVFGQRFSRDGVIALLGGEERGPSIDAALDEASRARFITTDATPYNGNRFAFRHVLLQEAAYAALPPSERARAHSRAGEWLAKRGSADPTLVAWHFERAGAGALAFPWFVAAARAALNGSDAAAVERLIERALACGPDGEDLAQALVLRAEGRWVQSNLAAATEDAEAAMHAAQAGGTTFYRATSVLIVAAGQRGDNARVAALAERLPPAAEPQAASLRAVCMCRAAAQLVASGARAQARTLIDTVDAENLPDALVRAGVARVRAGFDVFAGDYTRAIERNEEAARLFAAGGDLRTSCLVRLATASYRLWAGDAEAAHNELDVAESMARRTGASYFARWASYTRGKILALAGPPEVARAHLESIAPSLAASPRIRAGIHVHLAIAAMRAEDPVRAEKEARAALAAHAVPDVRAPALGALARALVRLGRGAEALEHATEARDIAASLGGLAENEALVHLAVAEAYESASLKPEASTFATTAAARLQELAGRLPTPVAQERFLHALDIHADTLRLAERLSSGSLAHATETQ